MSSATISLFSNGKLQMVSNVICKLRNATYLNTLALRQANPWFLLSDDKDIAFPSRKCVVNSVFDMYDIEASVVTFTVGDDANTAHVTTTSDHGDDTSIEADEVADLAGSKINLDSVVHLDSGIGIS